MRNFKHIIPVIILFLSFSRIASAQNNNDDELREYFNSIVLLYEPSAPIFQKINGKTYELTLKEPWTKKQVDIPTKTLGSGFIVVRGLDFYLITAEHVAKSLNGQSQIKFRGQSGEKKVFLLSEIVDNQTKTSELPWIRHQAADIAILHLGNDSKKIENYGFRAIDYVELVETLASPNRFKDLTIFGFPLGLGETSTTISPITKTVRSASDVVYIKRFDNSIENPFILLDDASIGGFSGGPVIEFNRVPSNTPKIAGKEVRLMSRVIGLVHGNRSGGDGLDGFAAIVPSAQIIEVLEKAPSYSGEYTYYYPDGSTWSERVYKNGLPWTVKSNYDKNGNPQEKGTLVEGSGLLYNWDEDGTIAEVEIYENGKYVGNMISIKKDVSDKTGN